MPQDNGGHERMHRDLSELELRPAGTRRAQQRDCDRWMIDFNEVRPHEALAGKTPAEVYRDSDRRSLASLVPSYPPEWKTRRVARNGNISIDDDVVFVTAALSGQIIGLQQESALRWRARFFDVDLGTLEIIPSLGDLYSANEAVTPPVSAIVNRGPQLGDRTVTASNARPAPRKKKAVNA